MKKVFTLLSFLCLACMCAWAQQATVQGVKVSGKPENGSWAENTTWYYMSMRWSDKINYLSTGSGYVDGANLKVNNQTRDLSDNGLWCVVANVDGYSFYNKGKGTEYAVVTSSDGKITIANTSTPTIYSIPAKKNNQAGISSWYIRDGVSGNNYWDAGGTTIQHWASDQAYGNNNGSVYFAEKLPDRAKISLKNRAHSFYLGYRDSDKKMEGKTSKDATTTWELVFTDGRYALRNGNYYMGAVPAGHDQENSVTTSMEDAEQFEFSQNADGYYLLLLSKEDTGCQSHHNYLHGVDWKNYPQKGIIYTTVRWDVDASASQWIIEPDWDGMKALLDKVEKYYNLLDEHALGKYNVQSPYSIDQWRWTYTLMQGVWNKKTADLAEVEDAKATLQGMLDFISLNMPKDGTFLRIHGYDTASGKYLLGTNSSDGKLQLGDKNTNNSKDAIFYYTDGKLLAYTNGQYVGQKAETVTNIQVKKAALAEVGGTASDITFREDASKEAPGIYYILVDGDTQWIGSAATVIDASQGERSGQGWRVQLEEVSELPVTIGTMGYASFYTPVTLAVPSEITPYVCHLDEDNLSMYTCKQKTNIDATEYIAIPANTAVVLKGTSGALNIVDDENVEEYDNNSFFGDVVTKPFAEDFTYYSLQVDKTKNDGSVGFFIKPSGNFKGFQAFLKTPADQPVARFNVSFDKDADVTGITKAFGMENANIPAFDLTGRKVNANNQSGLYIINGSKIIK